MSEIRIVTARRISALPDYRLEIVFSDDTMGVVDLSEFVTLGPITEPLGDPAFFARVFLETGIPTWPNGCDIDPINARMTLAAKGALRPVTAAA